MMLNSSDMVPFGPEIPHVFRLDEPVLHNTALVLQRKPLRVSTPAQSWAYSVAFKAQRDAFQSDHRGQLIVVEVDLEVEQGEIGVGGLTGDLQEFVGVETTVTPATGRTRAQVVVSDRDRFSWLMIRNGASTESLSIFRVYAIRGYLASQEPLADLCDVPRPELRNLLSSRPSPAPLILSKDARREGSC
jgi:hypothetical protein